MVDWGEGSAEGGGGARVEGGDVMYGAYESAGPSMLLSDGAL